MQLPKDVWDIWKAVADKFKALHQGSDDERREATKRGVQTIRAKSPGSKWVCKSQHNTGWAAASKDGLAYVESDPIITGRLARMEMFDMINGSTRETNAYPVHSHNHEEGNHEAYILVPEAFDWLTGVVAPPVEPPVEPVEPPPSNEVAALKAMILALDQRVKALETEVMEAALDAKDAKTLALRALSDITRLHWVSGPKGQDVLETNRVFAHAHTIRGDIKVVPE